MFNFSVINIQNSVAVTTAPEIHNKINSSPAALNLTRSPVLILQRKMYLCIYSRLFAFMRQNLAKPKRH